MFKRLGIRCVLLESARVVRSAQINGRQPFGKFLAWQTNDSVTKGLHLFGMKEAS